ncbi:vWA domain-containing protein [Shewanella salipaludis]|uniref:VWA domain-containing protein n=1 Tax=Shewanella salipaludis TaxID=2723052 RepID=A0A972JNC6_9GAMM|nr:VWA domain-containing protein [Shewanella salipaludis]NMH66036.1 VWA domain-containing protein [Shewanella salipaludis]
MTLHFIRPEWFLALLPLTLLLLGLWRSHGQGSAWNRYIAPHLARVLVTEGSQARQHRLWWLASSWFIAVLALSGPAVTKQTLPVFATEQGRVVIMDMSLSMYATDLAPNRLTQAKFRATDLLRGLKEGETGLIAYAGDAFTISPLTRDSATLLNLLPTLTPDIMPVRGSNLAAALSQASQLLAQGGHLRGDIILLTDGLSQAQFSQANKALDGSQYRLAVLALGSAQGAPIRLPDGQLLRDNANEVVIATTDYGLLQRLAQANRGALFQVTSDGQDLQHLNAWLATEGDAKATELRGENWQDLGPFLALLLLLPLLLSFRHGLVAAVLLVLLTPPTPAQAGVWEDLWHNRDQQGMQAFEAGNYADAAARFEDPSWQGSAQYKAGNFQQALQHFEQDASARGLYNQGNALMQLKQPEQAIKRYQQALAKQPDFPEAEQNLALAQQLAQQAKQQQDKNQNKDKGKNKNKNKDKDKDKDKDAKQDSQGNQDNKDAGQSDKEQAAQDQDPENQRQQQASEQAGSQQDDEPEKAAQSADKQQEQQANGDAQGGSQHEDKPNQQDQGASGQAGESASPNNEAKMQAQAGSAAGDEQAKTEAQQQAAQSGQAQSAEAGEPGEQASIAASQMTDEPLPADMERALRGVIEDPQVLLRNKMQLEYQKRRQSGNLPGDNEQW